MVGSYLASTSSWALTKFGADASLWDARRRPVAPRKFRNPPHRARYGTMGRDGVPGERSAAARGRNTLEQHS